MEYTKQDISENFPISYYSRGLAYKQSGQVKEVKYEDGKLIGQVFGSRARPYKVEVKIETKNQRVYFSGDCTCPMDYNCKHVVALLLAGLKINTENTVSDASNKIIDVTAEYRNETDKVLVFGNADNGLTASNKVSEISGVNEDTVIEKKPNVSDVKTVELDTSLSLWLEGLKSAEESRNKKALEKPAKLLTYVIKPLKNLSRRGQEIFTVVPLVRSVKKDGEFGSYSNRYKINNIESPSSYVKSSDLVILRLMRAAISSSYYYSEFTINHREEGLILLRKLIESGHAYLSEDDLVEDALRFGEVSEGKVEWYVREDGTQSLKVVVSGHEVAMIVPLMPLYYICPETRQVGEVKLDLKGSNLSMNQVMSLIEAPSVKAEQVGLFRQALEKLIGKEAEGLLPKEIELKNLPVKPRALLKLEGVDIRIIRGTRGTYGQEVGIAAVNLLFDYAGKVVLYNDSHAALTHFNGQEVEVMKRDNVYESKALQKLKELGLTMVLKTLNHCYDIPSESKNYLTYGQAKEMFHKEDKIGKYWQEFMSEKVEELKEAGWQIEMSEDFPYNIVKADKEWYAEIDDNAGGIDWFDVELGVKIEGQKVNLLPILLGLLKQEQDIFKTIKELGTKEDLLVDLSDGRRLALPAERAKKLLEFLQSIFSFKGKLDDEGRLRLQRLDAMLLTEMEAANQALNMRWFGGEMVRKLGKSLTDFTKIKEVNLADNFCGELRLYQQQGVNWLQFLREYKLSGVLADDMGLGKTVQVLAHISIEKAGGRLDKPVLVIAPTSLMVNWRLEATKFVPELKVLILHGIERKKYFKEIKDHDVVLTTYPLLLRDKEELLGKEYHTVILDEAQTIKNTDAKITQITNQLKSDYRLCMTGTPMENHLGELWSLFNFLLPGYLGSKKEFSIIFKTPIEKERDIRVSKVLSQRVKPFMLRRTKLEVIKDLPEKTEIVRIIELEGGQRDLYETIRVSMHEKVREEIASQGIGKSHIIVLDALLKLRQVCCDPSLLNIKLSSQVKQSAKREEWVILQKRPRATVGLMDVNN